MPKYLDETGLAHFWENIKTKLIRAETLPEVEVIAPVIDGSAVLVRTTRHSFLFDCGTSTGGADLADFLLEKNVERLDAVIITHMHYDHFDGFSSVLPFVDADTDVFVQMNASGNDEASSYTSRMSLLQGYLSEAGYKDAICPENGSIYKYGDSCSCQFYNTDTDYCDIYDNCIANNASNPNDSSTYRSSLNNYSLITILRIGDFVYVDAGDIEGEAERLNAKDMVKANVARVPHHSVNWMGYLDWFMNVSADSWFFTWGTTAERSSDRTSYTEYTWKLLNRHLISEVIHNKTMDVSYRYRGSSLLDKQGNKYFPNSVNSTTTSPIHVGFYNLLPPEHYDTNPYSILFMSVNDFMNVQKGYEPVSVYADKNSSYFANSRLNKELVKTLNLTTSLTDNSYVIVVYSGIMEVTAYHYLKQYTKLMFMSDYVSPTETQLNDSSYINNGKYRQINLGTQPVDVSLNMVENTTWSSVEGSGLTAIQKFAIQYADSITVFGHLSGSTTIYSIPCMRIASNGVKSGACSFSGQILNGTGFICIYINSTKVVTARKVEIQSNTTTPFEITRIVSAS